MTTTFNTTSGNDYNATTPGGNYYTATVDNNYNYTLADVLTTTKTLNTSSPATMYSNVTTPSSQT